MTEQMRNPVNIERRFTHRRRFHYRRAGIAADKSPPKAKAMNRHARNRPTRHINISWLARRLGIPIFTAITPQLLACYGQSPESVAARPRWLWDLLGAARHALSGHPPCRQSTPAAELYHIECSTLFPGLYMANCHLSSDWQFKQSVAVALPAVILKAGWLSGWAARFLPGRVAR